ncbi:hypothetical protein WBJ53_04880 [Spirosoma sp. SC4-14]|uniref:hypothetical protein n=1 Tax=Spirosoma sp. SC4-14 TaxID=3128900 RepID=UPI0030D2AFBA
MNKRALTVLFEQQQIPKDMYSLAGGLPNDAYCLQQTSQGWEVYYSERGIKSGLVFFPDEETACSYLYSLILSEVKKYK